MKYDVCLEREGVQIPAGTIEGSNYQTARFSYNDSYLAGPYAAPVSISLPLQEEPFSAERTKIFFEGLLPEGFTKRVVASRMHVDEQDYLSLLYGLGRECLGALRIITGEEDEVSGYEEISEEQVRKLAQEGVSKSAELVTKSHLSLTGASGKVGLYYDEGSGKWYLPNGLAPSTHIVKQSHVRLTNIVPNEQIALLTAGKCGIDVPESFIINTGRGGDEDVLFATKRYDRIFTENSGKIDGLRRPIRLHQEDFAQAMGISAAGKYELPGSSYLRKMFEILRLFSADPIRDQLKLWDRIIFNYLIGNTDAHVKNFSLLYESGFRSLSLAPAYDLVSTVIYESSTRDMAFSIGGEYSIDRITPDSFRAAAGEAGLGERIAMRHFEDMCERFESALRDAVSDLEKQGFVNAGAIAEQVLRQSHLHAILSL